MNEAFELAVTYKGKEVLFPARLEQQTRFTHRFVVDVCGQEFFFEPDEERCYRALIDPEQIGGNKKIDIELLEAIAASIAAVLK